MERRLFLASVMAVAVAQAGLIKAEEYGEGNARARLVASAGRQHSGDAVFLGVRFDIKPGWHIYWKNPGGAGLATDIRWRLPAGIDAADLQWPLPVAFTQSGDIPGYGYEGSVVLAAELRSANHPPDNAVVGASVSWLACRDVCVLGSAELEAPWAEIEVDRGLADWEESLPHPLEGSDAPFTLTTKGGLAAGKVGLWLQWRTAPQSIEFFPDPSDGLVVEDFEIQTRGGLTRIDAVVRSMAGLDLQYGTLDSVVVVIDENHRRRGWEATINLTENDR